MSDARRDLVRAHGLDPGARLYRVESTAGYRTEIEAASIADAVAVYVARTGLPADQLSTIYADGAAVVTRGRRRLATITPV